MQHIKIVTDSTADIPEDLVAALDVAVIYDYINFGTISLQDKIDISRIEFYNRLAVASEMPTTASPGVGEFEAIYRQVGAPEVNIVSLHPSTQFSALYNTAHLAAQSFPKGRITVIDSEQLSMGLGWMVIAAARAAQAGASVAEVVELVTAMKHRTRVWAALDTFEFLRRSGRVNWAQALVGALLRIKPMVEVRDGEVFSLDRVRTNRRAMARLIEETELMAPLAYLAILHSNWPEGAEELKNRLAHLSPQDQVLTVDVTPVIGVHVGPRGVGVAAVAAAPDR